MAGACTRGTQRGEVFGSTDNGASWYPIGASEGLVPQKIGDALTKLPQSVVRAFAFAVGPSQNDPLFVIVGTDRGVFMAADGGSTWTPQSNGLPGAQGGMSTTGILSFAVNDKVVYAATTAGLYKTNVEVSGTTPRLEWSLVKTDSAVAALTIAGMQVFIGTADGVYVQTASKWTRVLEGVGEVSVLSADGATIVAGAHGGGIVPPTVARHGQSSPTPANGYAPPQLATVSRYWSRRSTGSWKRIGPALPLPATRSHSMEATRRSWEPAGSRWSKMSPARRLQRG